MPAADSAASTCALLDFGRGRRLEQWGPVRVARPDVRALGTPALAADAWEAADATFEGRVGQGQWQTREPMPDAWTVVHDGLRFEVRLAPSMHLGLFPEQAAHWAWMRAHAPAAAPIDVLNLFAYTGGASLALSASGHRVTHVDASRPAVSWARRNATLNGLTTIRWIEDDARAFVRRERRRGRRYRGLVLDPPAFGRASGGVWRLDHDLEPLLDEAIGLLDPDARFVLVNVYGLEATGHAIGGLLADRLAEAGHPLSRRPGDAGVLVLPAGDGRSLATGVYARSPA